MDLFKQYEALAGRSDAAFERMKRDYPEAVLCRPGCADCCHAVFGLFLIEAAYLKGRFEGLDRNVRRQVLRRCAAMDRALVRMEAQQGDPPEAPGDATETLGRFRIRCPLLDDESSCVLYAHRPITCRVYGIPTRIQGASRVCGRAGFLRGASYPAFNLDEAQKELYRLSGELLGRLPGGRPEKASLLLSMSRTLGAPLEQTIIECFG